MRCLVHMNAGCSCQYANKPGVPQQPRKPGAGQALLAFGAALLLGACSFFSSPPPDTAARDAYRAAKAACELYELAPAERHTDEMDRTCRSIRLVCE